MTNPARTTCEVPGAIVFTVQDLFTPDECDEFLAAAAKVGYSGVEWEYLKSYRNCTRALVDDGCLADKIWAKLLPHLTQKDLFVRPFGIGADGTWTPKGVNSRLRISKYGEGGHFSPHRDSGFVVTDDFRSIYTILIYLNDGFVGGDTVFFDSTKQELVVIKPTAGTAVVFTHDAYHAGKLVTSGAKYILRTDIMFHSMDKRAQVDVNYLTDATYIEAEAQYQLSIAEQQHGRPGCSTDAFVKATELHAAHGPSVVNLSRSGVFHYLQAELIRKIASYMPIMDLLSLSATCKYGRQLITKDSVLWRNHYHDDIVLDNAGYVPLAINSLLALTYDWYNIYRNAAIVQKSFKAVILDIGTRYTRYCSIGSKGQSSRELELQLSYAQDDQERDRLLERVYQHPVGIIRSVFYRATGHYWGAGQGYGDMFLSDCDDEDYTHHTDDDDYEFHPYSFQDSLARPCIQQWNLIYEFISGYQIHDTTSRFSEPVAYIVPPFAFTTAIKQELLHDISALDPGNSKYPKYSVDPPFVAVMDAATAVTTFHEQTTAIVVSCGATFIWVCPVVACELAFDEEERRNAVITVSSQAISDAEVITWLDDNTLRVQELVNLAQERCPGGNIIVCGGRATVMKKFLETAHYSPVIVSDSPQDDIVRGAQLQVMLPGSRDKFSRMSAPAYRYRDPAGTAAIVKENDKVWDLLEPIYA